MNTDNSIMMGQLIVVAEVGTNFDAALPFVTNSTQEYDALKAVLREYNASITPLYSTPLSENTTNSAVTSENNSFSDAPYIYVVETPTTDLGAIASKLAKVPGVAAAYITPQPGLPIYHIPKPKGSDLYSLRSKTMNYRPLQTYLDPAPEGVNVEAAWSLPGGKGENVRIIDVEYDWNLTHEDLIGKNHGVLGGRPSGDFPEHGTAVVATLCADDNGIGITGVAPNAKVDCVSINGWVQNTQTNPYGRNMPAAIERAAGILNPGDILVIEVQWPGPRYNYTWQAEQKGCIPVEWFPDCYIPVKNATKKGVIVISVAGNGWEHLDDPIYDRRDPDWGTAYGWWENPFRRHRCDSGSILVGAGAPPTEEWGPDRSRLEYSNYGSCVDCQGWGDQVATAGYGSLQGGPFKERWYTAEFSGTSAATPLIAGVIACLSGAMKRSNMLLTPARARQLLRDSGSPQQDLKNRPRSAALQPIGSRPNLKELLRKANVIR